MATTKKKKVTVVSKARPVPAAKNPPKTSTPGEPVLKDKQGNPLTTTLEE